jgi:hypothetical protein
MAKNIRETAEAMGAKCIAELPDVGGGTFGMARLAHIMCQRLEAGHGRRAEQVNDCAGSEMPRDDSPEEYYPGK